MLFQITQICFNESDYVTLHSTLLRYAVMNVITEKGARMQQ